MQGTSAELLAKEWALPRDALDAYSLESHRRAIAAIDEGRFEGEIVPIELPEEPARGGAVTRTRVRGRRGGRRETSPEELAALAPAFQADGVVTAGQLVADRGRRRCGVDHERAGACRASGSSRARASFRSGSPASTRRACCTATRRRSEKALDRAGLTLDDIGVFEVNEAFAVVVLQTAADLAARRPDG